MAKRKWQLRSGSIREVVQAADQWEAFDALRDRPVEDFGMVVEAEPDEDRKKDAASFVARMVELGYPNTSSHDRKAVRAMALPTPKD